MERWIKDAELHYKLQRGFTSTAVMAHNICWVDGLICIECLTTTFELCSTLSVGKGRVYDRAGCSKVCAHWVSQMMTDVHKERKKAVTTDVLRQ
jgi:hypothetical protein